MQLSSCTVVIDLHNPLQLPVMPLLANVSTLLMDGFYWVPKGSVDAQVLVPCRTDLYNVAKCNTILLMHFNLLPVFFMII